MNVASNGQTTDNWSWGVAVYTTCTLTALGKAALVVTMWTKFTVIAIPGSFLLWLGWYPAYATIAPMINVSDEYRGVLRMTYPLITFWGMVFGVAILCLLRDFAWKYFKEDIILKVIIMFKKFKNIIFKIIDQEWNNFKSN